MSETAYPRVDLIEKFLSVQPAKTLDVNGIIYIDKAGAVERFIPPAPTLLKVHTLTGFVDLIEAGFEGFNPASSLVHVVDQTQVELVSTKSDNLGRRQVFVQANVMQQDVKFRFNEFYDQEAFNIGLRSLFVPSTELDDLQAISGNLANQKEVRQEDDGITQRVTAKAGVHMLAERVVKPRVTLAPYRTFREVDQPTGDFIFRVRGGEVGNKCALFEADGGYWKIKAIATVQEYLSNQLKGSQAAGLSDMPVIA